MKRHVTGEGYLSVSPNGNIIVSLLFKSEDDISLEPMVVPLGESIKIAKLVLAATGNIPDARKRVACKHSAQDWSKDNLGNTFCQDCDSQIKFDPDTETWYKT